jgi:SAM-dependent methyltransferase
MNAKRARHTELDGTSLGADDLGTVGPVDYDAELQRHNIVLRQACGIGRDDRVLDIGCGTGQTTREAARLAVAGHALGVDVSAAAIARAREPAEAEGLGNVSFEQADAATHGFPAEHFDIAISRFGTMFFGEPLVAFRNIARAIRTGGRLVMMVWQECERNEWLVSIRDALVAGESTPTAFPGTPDPFSLADPIVVEGILDAAGFSEFDFTDVHEPVYYGKDVDTALEWVRGFSYTQAVLRQLGPVAAEFALERLREMIAEHQNGFGVWFDSRAWIVTANRRPQPRKQRQTGLRTRDRATGASESSDIV